MGLFSSNTNGGNLRIVDGVVYGGYSDPSVSAALQAQRREQEHNKKMAAAQTKKRKQEQLKKKQARSAKSDPKKNGKPEKKGWW